jgi:hypothetical protein
MPACSVAIANSISSKSYIENYIIYILNKKKQEQSNDMNIPNTIDKQKAKENNKCNCF